MAISFLSLCQYCAHMHFKRQFKLMQAFFLGGEIVAHCCVLRYDVISAITVGVAVVELV